MSEETEAREQQRDPNGSDVRVNDVRGAASIRGRSNMAILPQGEMEAMCGATGGRIQWHG